MFHAALIWISISRNLNLSSFMFLTVKTEDKVLNKDYIEETNRDAVMIAAAKMVAVDAVPKVIVFLKFDFLSLFLTWTCWEFFFVITYEYDCYLFDPKIQFLRQKFLGPEIISPFVMHGNGVAEIVKNLITVLKKKDDDLSIIFLEALKRVRLMTGVMKFHLVKDADNWVWIYPY